MSTTPSQPAPPSRRPISPLGYGIIAFAAFAPADGYRQFSEGLGFKPLNILGYLIVATALPSLAGALRRPHLFLRLWGLSMGVTVLVSLVVAVAEGGEPQRALLTYIQMFVLAWLAGRACENPRVRHLATCCLFVGFTISIAVFIGLYRSGIGVMEDEIRVLGVFGYKAHIASLHAAWIALLGLTVAHTLPSWLRHGIRFVTIPLCIYVVFITNARAAHLSLVGGLAATVLIRRLTRKRERSQSRILVITAVAFGLVFAALGSETVGSKLSNITMRWTEGAGIAGISSHRTELLEAGWKLALEKPLGWGAANSFEALARNVPQADTDRLDPHNDFLNVLLDGGFLAFFLFTAAHLRLLWDTFTLARTSALAWPFVLTVAIQLAFFGAVNSYDKVCCLVLGLVVGATAEAHAAAAAALVSARAPAPAPERRPAALGRVAR